MKPDSINTPLNLLVKRNTVVYCKYCGSNITNAQRYGAFYSCETCDAWTNQIEIKDAQSALGIINTGSA
jgi:hypothetical protein